MLAYALQHTAFTGAGPERPLVRMHYRLPLFFALFSVRLWGICGSFTRGTSSILFVTVNGRFLLSLRRPEPGDALTATHDTPCLRIKAQPCLRGLCVVPLDFRSFSCVGASGNFSYSNGTFFFVLPAFFWLCGILIR